MNSQEILKKNKKYFYLYKITNNINHKFYYGIHCTNNLNDNYMGSGKLLHKAYDKYGIENFTKEIIHFCNSLEEVSNLEKQIVNEELLNNPLCYNIIKGGYYLDEETLKHIGEMNSKNQLGKNNSQFGTTWINDGEKNLKISKDNLNLYIQSGWNIGRITTMEFKQKMKKINSNRCWVYKDNETHQIDKNDLQEYLNNGYKRGRCETIVKEKKYDSDFSFKGYVYITYNGDNFWVKIDDPKYLSGEYIPYNKGKVSVKDKNGNKIGLVDKNDPKLLSGEYIKNDINHYWMIGKAFVKDNNGNKFFIDKNDERYKNGELVGINKGRKWKQKGDKHFNGYKWMYKDNIQTRVSPNKFNEYLEQGYNFGKLSIKK